MHNEVILSVHYRAHACFCTKASICSVQLILHTQYILNEEYPEEFLFHITTFAKRKTQDHVYTVPPAPSAGKHRLQPSLSHRCSVSKEFCMTCSLVTYKRPVGEQGSKTSLLFLNLKLTAMGA